MEINKENNFKVNDILNIDELEKPHILSSEVRNKFPSITHSQALKDIELFTKVIEYILNDELAEKDAHDFEDFRAFRRDFLRERGIFYSEGISTMNRFPVLRNSSMPTTVDVWDNRYMIPIKLPDGSVFTWMGWTNDPNRPKYQIPYLPWIKQGDMLGNLESLYMYEGRDIYVCEGYMDAARINESLEKKSVANLGSNLYKVPRISLKYLKDKGHRLIYVPDLDETGMGKVVESDLWDDIVCFDGEKDVDKFFRVLSNKAKKDEEARMSLESYKLRVPERKILIKD